MKKPNTVIAVVNEKGGTGKTTTAVSLSAAMAETGRRVLLVDLDGQAAASRWLGVEDDDRLADVLRAGGGLQPLRDVLPKLDLAPASGKLDSVSHDLRPTQGGQLRKALNEVVGYDFIFIDCPPSLGNRLIGNALLAATHVLVPVETSILALDGLKILLTTLEDVREGFGHDLLLAGVLACRFDGRTKLSRMVLEELRRALPGKVFDTVIRENVRMRECPASGESIFSFAPDCNAAKDYRTLAQEMIAEPEKWLSATGDGSDIFAGMSVESLRDNAAARVRDDSAARNVRKAALEGSAEEDAELSRADTIDLSVEEAQIPDLPWAPWQMPPAGETESKTTRSATPPPLPNEIGERPPAFEMPPAGEPQPAPAPETTASTPERAGDEPPLPNASETEDVPYDSPAPAESPQPVRPARSPDGSAYDEATQSLETWLESLRAAKHRLEHKADDVDEQPPAENAPIHDEPAGLDELGTFDGETDPAETNDRDAAPAEPDEQHAHTVPSWAHWMTHAPDELEPHEDQRAAQPDVAEEPAPEEPDASPADELPSVEAEPYDEPMASEPDAGDEPPPRAEATNVPEAAPDDRGDVASPESRQPETATSPPAPAEGASRDEGDERGMVLMPSLPPKHSAQAAGAAQETPAATAPGPAAPEDDAHKHNHGADESSGDPERFPALKSLLERIKSGDAGAEGNSKK